MRCYLVLRLVGVLVYQTSADYSPPNETTHRTLPTFPPPFLPGPVLETNSGMCEFINECSTCYCDRYCELYDDCCVDYIRESNNETTSSSGSQIDYGCIDVHTLLQNARDSIQTLNSSIISSEEDTYEVNITQLDEMPNSLSSGLIKAVYTCPSSWEDDKIADNCANRNGLLLPATDLSTGVSYKNVYCAICNGITNATIWSINYVCGEEVSTETEVMDKCTIASFSPPPLAVIHKCFTGSIISSCPSYQVASEAHQGLGTEQYDNWVAQCSKYQRLVMADGEVFRNEYCAICNGYNIEVQLLKLLIMHTFAIKFTLCFFYTVDLTISEAVSCTEGEVFDSVLMRCRSVFGSDHFLEGPVNCTSLNLSCTCNTLIALNESEFEYAGNNTVIFNGDLLEIQLNTSEGMPVVCVNFSRNGTIMIIPSPTIYPAGYDIVTYIGCSLSLIACFLVFLTFALFKELRTLSTKILMNIVATIAVVNLLLILTSSGGAAANSGFCQAVAVFLHFFILTQFTWMTVMAVEMVHTFYQASRLVPVKSEGIQYKFTIYSIVCWSVPSVIVGISVIVNYTSSDLVQYGGTSLFDIRVCWINHFYSFLAIFFIPIAIATAIQSLLFVAVVVLICLSGRRKTKESSSNNKNIPYFRIFIALFFASNVMWLFGFLALLINTEWAWYPFIILQSLQGCVIFLGFFCTKKIFERYTSMEVNSTKLSIIKMKLLNTLSSNEQQISA